MSEHARERSSEKVRVAGRRARKWMAPGMGVKRWVTVLVVCAFFLSVGFLHFVWTGPMHWIATRWILLLNTVADPKAMPLWTVGALLMLLALAGAVTSVVMLNRTLLQATGTKPSDVVDFIYARRALSRGPKIVALGGGTGLSNLLSGLKNYSSNITAVVTVSDDGGSSGRLRKDLEMIAPGDLTDCYAALSDSPVLARLLLHRFARGEGLEGHTFGNLMLATLSEEQGGLANAMSDVHEVLKVRGQVFPATSSPATLVARLEGGDVVRGESALHQERAGRRVERMQLDPENVPALPEVIEALLDADLIVLGPGSLLTSLVPAVLVRDVSAAIRASPARLVYVANIMSERGETDELSLEDHERVLSEHIGRAPDWVLVNSAPITVAVRERYAREGARMLSSRGASPAFRARVRYAAVLREGSGQHDPEKLGLALLRLLARGQ